MNHDCVWSSRVPYLSSKQRGTQHRASVTRFPCSQSQHRQRRCVSSVRFPEDLIRPRSQPVWRDVEADRRATPSGEPCIKARSRDLFVWARTRAHGCCLCCPGSVPIISACGVRRGEQAPYWYWYWYWYCSAPARSGCRSGVSITHLWLYMP